MDGMTEKEKAQRGMLYDANYDPELLAERDRAKELLWDYNRLRPSQHQEREALLRELLGKTGENPLIEQPFCCDYGYNIEVGDHFFANVNLVVLDGAKVTIGNHVFVGPNVSIYTAGHPLDVARRNNGLEYARPVRIEDDVWIGGNVVILPGITIGKGAVIAAGSVVSKDVPAGVLALGNPCRVRKTIAERQEWPERD